jgi:4-hydroxythreonine-4-phosphate dehydrogenase
LKTSWPSTRTLSSRPFFEPDVATVPPSVNPHSIGSDAVFVDLNHLDPAAVERGTASEAGGTFALENYRRARPGYDDEIAFFAELAGLQTPASEFNVLDKPWNARVTSHIALKDVASPPNGSIAP